MAVIRIEKTKNYTTMSNYHLRDTKLSLKAKGLMSLMLSLPEDWDYTTKGLAYICKEGIDSISAALKELELQGYLIRERVRLPGGCFGSIEYTILEEPKKPADKPNPPKREKPRQVSPVQASPVLGNPAQLNKDKQNKEIKKEKRDQIDAQVNRVDEYRELIKKNIDYDNLVVQCEKDKLDTLVELMLEVVVSDNPYCLIAKERLPREVVRSRMLKIDCNHIDYVLERLDKTTSKVGNAKAYVLATLFNAPVNMENQIRFEVNHNESL